MQLARRGRLILLPFFLLVAGCMSQNKGKLEGTRWRSEAATVSASRPGPGYGQSARLPEGFIELDFHIDGSFFYIVAGKIYTGKYSLGAGNLVTLNLDKPLAGSKTHTERIAVNNDKMTMTDSDGTELTFKKQP